LEVIDDSSKHQGHVGSQGGAGHYSIVIAADYFRDKNRVAAHQEIYRLFAAFIPGEIHALSIKIIT
jgi:BolA protein